MLSGGARLLPLSEVPPRVVGTRNTSRNSWRVGPQALGFCNVASFSWRRMTRSKVESNVWETMTQFIMDRQYAGKKDSGSVSTPARTEAAPCSSVIVEVKTSYGRLSS